MVIHSLGCVFVHIPKSAGSSIESFLLRQAGQAWERQDHRPIAEYLPVTPLDAVVGLRHRRPLLARKARNWMSGKPVLTKQQDATYYKFAFVRNPWDRVVSWYRNVIRDPNHRRNLGITQATSFENFLWEQKANWALRSQLYWLTDCHGKIHMDFVGRFESLQRDFKVVCNTLGIPQDRLPPVLVSRQVDYREYFTHSTRNWIREWYRDEIDLFGYEF